MLVIISLTVAFSKEIFAATLANAGRFSNESQRNGPISTHVGLAWAAQRVTAPTVEMDPDFIPNLAGNSPGRGGII
jgi:hypothetical protein